MKSKFSKSFKNIYPVSRSVLGEDKWSSLVSILGQSLLKNVSSQNIAKKIKGKKYPSYIGELLYLERMISDVSEMKVDFPREVNKLTLNPALRLLNFNWQLCSFMENKDSGRTGKPRKGKEWVAVWRRPDTKKINIEKLSGEDLLAIKMAVENVSIEKAAGEGKVSSGQIENLLRRVARKGIIFLPVSRIKRAKKFFSAKYNLPERFLVADTFTLQWHITNACDLHCKHCYDRTRRSPMTLKQGLRILKDLDSFCKNKHVRGHVCFTGGNPFLSPHFFELYQRAVDLGFSTSILGNPVSEQKIKRLLNIKKPSYFQVSLEGLIKHNDSIRGKGNFNRVMEFLDLLGELNVSRAVMLTLTKDNVEQVIPLASLIRKKTEHFTFNRLSQVGEGVALPLPSKKQFISLLSAYMDEAKVNPIIGYKDNLISILLYERKKSFFGGCTGFGCGAAFNFIALLPDGEAHACRKFPSPIGNVNKSSILDIYESPLAKKYRKGTEACWNCSFKPVCGGCMAIVHSHKLNVFKDKDPYCFASQSNNPPA